MLIQNQRVMIVLALLLAYLLPFGDADPLGHLCGGVTGGDYTAQSTYGANLELLPAALRKNASSGLFTKGSVGAAPHTVYGLGLCRGDASACGDCIGAAFGDVQQLCPLNRDARALHEKCVLSYSSHDFASYGSNATESLLVVVWPDDVKVKPMHPGNGESVVSEMIDEIAMMAAYSLTTARYATGRVDVNSTGAPPRRSTLWRSATKTCRLMTAGTASTASRRCSLGHTLALAPSSAGKVHGLSVCGAISGTVLTSSTNASPCI
uniref:Gnk2-homologous domain-containing protein n=1 Tax=Aegilops tauschii subsp. strangulata TaxID=200361 RepID=A0A452ZI73_AEGTS